MPAQNGKDLLLKMDLSGSGDFQTIAGLRATRLSFNAQSVDATSLDSQGWRELLVGAGVRSASVSGSGIFKDAASDAKAREAFFNAEAPQCQVIIPDFGTIEGAFQITGLEYSGNHDGEAAYELNLASAGALSFAAL
ncbi:MAG: phage major tail protein, TP901-1 family [Mangrovicoccus sp.]|nr:phage major tail protein, TP901-1 family [Mangrovicoccus sp.]